MLLAPTFHVSNHGNKCAAERTIRPQKQASDEQKFLISPQSPLLLAVEDRISIYF